MVFRPKSEEDLGEEAGLRSKVVAQPGRVSMRIFRTAQISIRAYSLQDSW